MSGMHETPSVPPTTPPTAPPHASQMLRQPANPIPLALACVGLAVPPLGLVGGGLGVMQYRRAVTSRDRGMGIGAAIVGFVGVFISSVCYVWIGFVIASGLGGARSGFESARMARAMAELSVLSALLAPMEVQQGGAPVHPLTPMLSGEAGQAHQIQRILERLVQDADMGDEALTLRGVSLIGVGRSGPSTEELREAFEAQLAEDSSTGWTQFANFGLVYPELRTDVHGLIRMWYSRNGGTRVMVLLTGGEVVHLTKSEWEDLQVTNAELRAEHDLGPLPDLPMDPRNR